MQEMPTFHVMDRRLPAGIPLLASWWWRILVVGASLGLVPVLVVTWSFIDEPFDGHDVELTWVEEDVSGVGNWYRGTVAGTEMSGWLCPALQLYFEGAPPRIFVKAEKLPRGVNPIWHPSGDIEPRRFVEAPR